MFSFSTCVKRVAPALSTGRRVRGCRLGLVLWGCVGIGVLASPASGVVYPDGPPPAHTGGFGEPTCHRCHFDQPPDAPGGSLVLEGVPDGYAPGARYRLAVLLAHPAMRRGGFELAVRFAGGTHAGRQAGTLRAVDDRAAVAMDDSTGVQYAHQTKAGAALEEAQAARWILEWIAPKAAHGPVAFHAAANAANDDASEFGDFVYLQEASSAPAQ